MLSLHWTIVRGCSRQNRSLISTTAVVGINSILRHQCPDNLVTTYGQKRHHFGGGRGGHNHERDHSHSPYDSPGHFTDRETGHRDAWSERNWKHRAFTVGIGGPVGSGKTALVLKLVEELRDVVPIGVVTNDIFTQEDAEFLVRAHALPPHRIIAVETGGCPHAAIREDISANLGALERLTRLIATEQGEEDKDGDGDGGAVLPPLLFCESGGDNLAANFSQELADFTIYVIDVAGGDKVPRKGGPGITQSDVLVINKIDLAEAVDADLDVMSRDAARMRGGNDGQGGPVVFAAVRHRWGVSEIKQHVMNTFKRATQQGPVK